MRFLISLATVAFLAAPAWAVCPAHAPTITATPSGAFRLCAPEVDADNDPVTASFYASCTVSVTWQNGLKSAFVNLTTITPGAPQLVSFPAAKGAGMGVGFCTNTEGVVGANSATSAVTFRRGNPAAPGLSQ